MMMIEAMKQALEALEVEYRMYEATDPETGAPYNMIQAITALQQAIAEAEKQEPIKWQDTRKTWVDVPLKNVLTEKREWVGLTDDEIQELHTRWNKEVLWDEWNYERAIEQALKEKNT